MDLNEAREFLEKIKVTHPELSVRLVLGMPIDNELQVLMDTIKKLGCAAHLQSSAYRDIEVVVTDGYIGSSQKKTS